MTRTLLGVFVVTGVCIFLNARTGYGLSIDIAPKSVNGLVHNEVHIRCKLDNSDADVREIMLLELSKEGKAVALHRPNSKTSVGDGMSSKFQAEGNISTSVYESYIDVTLADPEVEDAGSYTCQMFYLDRSNVLKEAKTSDNLTVSDDDLKAAIKQLVAMQTEHSARVEQMKRDFLTKEAELQDQKRQIKQLKDSLQDLNDKENRSVLFTALHTRTGGVFQAGKTLVFGHVVVNEGGGYDGNTGTFTAPVPGYYLLGVSINSKSNKWIVIDLQTSKGQVLTRLMNGEPQWTDNTDTSCVVKLEAGQSVMPVIREVYSGFAPGGRDTPDYSNKFFGYLLKAI